MGFIDKIAPIVQKYAPMYDIKVCSPIIAQAILESASGQSELASVCNYFGMKYRENRCPSAIGYYIKNAVEQNADGTYYNVSDTKWFRFPNMDAGVQGYFDFVNTKNYANLKNVTDPRQYLENIKADGYATSVKYVDNLMAVISKYNLTKYDIFKEEEKKMVINVHAGHNPEGKVASGAAKYLNESRENRKVKDLVIKYLREQGHTVYDCTCDNGTSVSDVLNKIIEKCNAHTVDLDVSIHFNAGTTDSNSLTTGTEVLVYSTASKSVPYAKNTVDAIAALGFTNRGIKTRTDLAFLRRTKAPAMLIECCFVDDKDDANLYDPDKMARAIVKGITGKEVEEEEKPFIICPHCGQKIYM